MLSNPSQIMFTLVRALSKPMARTVKDLPAMQETIPGSGRLHGKGNATQSSILAWRIPWTEKPGGLQSMGSQRVGHISATKTFKKIQHTLFSPICHFPSLRISILTFMSCNSPLLIIRKWGKIGIKTKSTKQIANQSKTFRSRALG